MRDRWIHLCCILLTLGAPQAGATEGVHAPETYSRLKLSVGGYFYSGKVNQLQGNFQGHYGLSSPDKGLDFLFNGFRLWTKADQATDYEVTGDDLFGTLVPFYYLSDQVYVLGLGRFESSQSLRLNRRLLIGAGVGYAPVRSKAFLIRISLLPTYEHAQFDGENFRLDIPHEGPERSTMRLTVASNGWYRVKETPVTFRYFAQVNMNPEMLRDYRLNIVGNIDLKIVDALAFRTSFFVTHDASLLEGFEPTNIRSTVGFAWTAK